MTLKSISGVIVLLSASLSFGSVAKDMVLEGKDGHPLAVSYYSADSKATRGVLMLHQCNYNRSMYDAVGKELSKNGIHALSLDFRGYGDSSNDKFNVEVIRKMETQERRKSWAQMSGHWASDVQIAYDFLADKISGTVKIGVIGASCGGGQGVRLSESRPISAIGFFSSYQGEENMGKYEKSLSELPTLIIAAEGDGSTFTTAQALFDRAKNQNSRMISYKGNAHGYPLYDIDNSLVNQISTWFVQHLK